MEGEHEGPGTNESNNFNANQIRMRMRSEAMFELRRLRHQCKLVSDFDGRKLLDEHLQQRGRASDNGNEKQSSVSSKQTASANGVGTTSSSPTPGSLMPEAIRLEIRGLFERRRVSEVLHTPEVVQNLERAVQDTADQRRGRRTRRPRAQPAAPITRHVRPQPRPRAGPRAARRPNGSYSITRRDQSTILDGVRSSPALNSLGPEARDRVVTEIGNLVQQQLVTSALTGEFRGVLELHIQERADRVQRGEGVDQLLENLHRRDEYSEAASASAARANISSDISVSGLQQEMTEMKAHILELKQLMKLCFDLQLDLQRSLRQEVAAVFSNMQSAQQPVVTSVQEVSSDHVNAQLMQSGNCTICSEASIDSVIYRCGHMCVCMACGLELKAQGLKCPICRAPITDIIRAYSSMC